MTSKRTIRKIFIANRGEICRRVALTARRMGITSACLSDKDVPASYLLGVIDHFIKVESESVALYLDAEKMLLHALEAQADAIHPGYGFLSENEAFAQRVIDAGLIWLGPPPAAMAAMAHKSEARALALDLSVPCIQGLSVPPHVQERELIELASRIAYPILLKAAKGGGGKGMRVVDHSGELWEKAQHAFSEAKNYFGDGTLLMERYLSHSRHIEVQILGDQFGTVMTLGDRDCSIQRRYQKIVEEAPALGLTEATRTDLYQCALKLAKKVAYSSCGTIEFLVDWSPKSQNAERQEFFFLEMNTRLQVEHPVTECVWGVDLVEWQIRVARGEKLSAELLEARPHGHAIEVRVYAEDPSQNFFPSPGKVFSFLPAMEPGIRWEIGLDTVDEISTKFDPLIAKLVAYGADRKASIERMRSALEQTFFAGPITNLEFLQAILTEAEFRAAPVDTHYLKAKAKALPLAIEKGRELLEKSATEILSLLEERNGHLMELQGPELGGIDEKSRTIFAQRPSPKILKLKDQAFCVAYELSRKFSTESPLTVVYGQGFKRNAHNSSAFFYASARNSERTYFYVKLAGHLFSKRWEKALVQQTGGLARKQDQIPSPVPGRILKILVQAEQKVEAQQSLFILDSMKMEFIISSHHPGAISEIRVREGDQVDAGQILANFKSIE